MKIEKKPTITYKTVAGESAAEKIENLYKAFEKDQSIAKDIFTVADAFYNKMARLEEEKTKIDDMIKSILIGLNSDKVTSYEFIYTYKPTRVIDYTADPAYDEIAKELETLTDKKKQRISLLKERLLVGEVSLPTEEKYVLRKMRVKK